MKMSSLISQHLRFHHAPSKLIKPTFLFAYSSSSSQNLTTHLTQQEVTKINLLIPRLCLTNKLNTAIQLTVTALTTNPPPKSISYSILILSLTSQPKLSLPISLLSKLNQIQTTRPLVQSHLTPITTLLISSYLKKGSPKAAFKVYEWMLRSGCLCRVEKTVFDILVDGICKFGLVFEALRVLRDMMVMEFLVNDDLRKRVFRSLLREARIKEAKELDEALGRVGNGEGEGAKKVLALLDEMIANWSE